MEINAGDFIIGKGEVWEILNISRDGANTEYEIKQLTAPGEFLEIFNHSTGEYEKAEMTSTMKVSHSYIKHLGKIVPKGESDEAIQILFGK